jgi:hypothetical protein
VAGKTVRLQACDELPSVAVKVAGVLVFTVVVFKRNE